MRKLSNITPNEFARVLLLLGFTKTRTKGGHEAWTKEGIARPVIFQTHINPIPEFVVVNNLRTIGLSRKDFISLLETL